MKRNKKGFTLIELLAVIVILAIIALIAVPVIMNIINKANKSAFKDTAYGIISAGELYFAERQLDINGMDADKTFTLPSNELDIKGEVPEGTVLMVNTKGQVSLGMTNGRYCITKGFEDTDVTITEDEECYYPSTFRYLTTTEHECTAKGQTCVPGETLFTLNVNSKETKNFYVLSDDGKTITLIMDSNLGEEVTWDSEHLSCETYYEDFDGDGVYDSSFDYCDADMSYGPATLLQQLDARTASWTNIPERNYTISGLDELDNRVYADIAFVSKARLLTYKEAISAKSGNDNNNDTDVPVWLYTHLSLPDEHAYWLSTPFSLLDDSGWRINNFGHTSDGLVYQYNGIRPVITLNK